MPEGRYLSKKNHKKQKLGGGRGNKTGNQNSTKQPNPSSDIFEDARPEFLSRPKHDPLGGHNVRLHKDAVHLIRHFLAEDFQQGAVGGLQIFDPGGRSRLFLNQQLDNVPILRFDALEFFGRAAGCEGGVLYK